MIVDASPLCKFSPKFPGLGPGTGAGGWGRSPLHFDNIASLLRPWSEQTFPTCDLVCLPRPLSLRSLPTKADFNPDSGSPLPPSDNEVLLFSNGSKTGRTIGTTFIHFHPPDPTTKPRLHPPDATTQAGNDTAPHPYPPNSITEPYLLSLPWHMSAFDVGLYAACCALQYAASLYPLPRIISLAFDNQAIMYATSRPRYSYQAPHLRDICNATSALLLSDSTVQAGWTSSHTGVTDSELADAAAKPAAEGTPGPLPDDFPLPYSHLRTQIRSHLLREWQI